MKDMATSGSLAALLLFLIVLCLYSSVQGDETDAIIDKALKSSGIAGQVEMLGETVLSMMPADALPSDRVKTNVTAAVKKAANGKVVLTTLRASVKEDFDLEKMKQVAEFYDAKLGRKVGLLLRNALEARSVAQAREGRNTLTATDENRVALLKRIIRADGVVELTAGLADTVMRGLLDGSLGSSADRKDGAQEGLRPPEIRTGAWENHIEDQALVSFALTLRSLDARELEQLATFCESDAAGWFRNAVRKGVEKAVYQAARALSEAATDPARPASPAN